MNEKNPWPVPWGIRIVQIILSAFVGLLALRLWGHHLTGYIAFVITFTVTYVGIGVIYLADQLKQ